MSDWGLFDLRRPPAIKPDLQATNSPSPQPSVTGCPIPDGWIPYVVSPTDSLFRLSVIYGVSVEVLQKFNCMGNETVILPGQIINVPNPETPTLNPSNTSSPNPVILLQQVTEEVFQNISNHPQSDPPEDRPDPATNTSQPPSPQPTKDSLPPTPRPTDTAQPPAATPLPPKGDDDKPTDPPTKKPDQESTKEDKAKPDPTQDDKGNNNGDQKDQDPGKDKDNGNSGDKGKDEDKGNSGDKGKDEDKGKDKGDGDGNGKGGGGKGKGN